LILFHFLFNAKEPDRWDKKKTLIPKKMNSFDELRRVSNASVVYTMPVENSRHQLTTPIRAAKAKVTQHAFVYECSWSIIF